MEELSNEMEQSSERFRRHSFHSHRRQRDLKQDMDDEYRRSRSLREENRHLAQRLERMEKKLDQEKSHMRKIVSKSNHLKALSFVVL